MPKKKNDPKKNGQNNPNIIKEENLNIINDDVPEGNLNINEIIGEKWSDKPISDTDMEELKRLEEETLEYWKQENKRQKDKERRIAFEVAYSPDDLEMRIDFLEKPATSIASYMGWTQIQFDEILRELLQFESESDTDKLAQFILIDGVRGDQIWADKYKNISSSVERERLYRAEIVKVIMQGEKDIKLRYHDKLSNGKAVERGVVTMLPSRRRVEKMINSVALYRMHSQKFLSALDRFKDVMLENCGNRKDKANQTFLDMSSATFFAISMLAGSAANKDELKENVEYKDYIAFLKKNVSIDLHQNPLSVTIDSIKDLFNKMDSYIEDNREAEPEGVALITQFKETLSKELSVMTGITEELTGDVLLNKDGVTFENAALLRIEEKINQYKEIHERYGELNLKTADELEEELLSRNKKVEISLTYPLRRERILNKLKNGTKLNTYEVTGVDTLIPVREEQKNLKARMDAAIKYVVPADKRDRLFSAMIRCGFLNTRESTDLGVFCSWVMGYKGLSIPDIATIFKNDKSGALLDEFISFCEKNPVRDENAKPDEARKYLDNWNKVMKKTAEMFLDYQIPDIDYNNKEALDKYLFELRLMNEVSVDFIQEYIERFSNFTIPGGVGSDGKEYKSTYIKDCFAEEFGGNFEYMKTINAIRNAQSYSAIFEHGFNYSFSDVIWNTGNSKKMVAELSTLALLQSVVKSSLGRVRGMKISDIANKESNLNHLYRMINDEVYPRIIAEEINIDSGRVLDYLEGKNPESFSNYLETQFFAKGISRAKRLDKGERAAYGHSMSSLSSELIHKLISTETIEGYRNIIESKEHGAPIVDIITRATNSLFDLDVINAHAQRNLSCLDVIKVDGKTPEELWGEKFAQADNGFEKEMFYRMELIKETIKGDREIRLAGIKLDRNYEYKLTGKTYIASPKKSDVKNIIQYRDYLEKMLADMSQKLDTYKNQLASVQANRRANFESNRQEGSQEYQNMCKALVDLKNYLQDNPKYKTLAELRMKVAKFEAESKAYYKRGKTSHQQKLTTAQEAFHRFSGYLGVIDDISKAFDLDIPVFSLGKTIRNSPIREVDVVIDKYKDYYRYHNPLPALNNETQSTKLEELVNLRREQSAYMDVVDSFIGKYPDTSRHISTEGVAKLVVQQQFKELISAQNTTEQILHEATRISKDDIKTRINDLKNNKVFKVVAERFQTETPNKWKRILERAQTLNTEYTNYVNNYSGVNAIRYIHENKAFSLTAAKNYRRDDKYDKLGEIVAKQILIRPESKELLQGMAAEQFEFADLKKVCAEHLREKGILDRSSNGYVEDARLTTMLQNGELRNTVLAKVSEPLKRVVDQRARRHAANQQERAAQNIRP